MSTTELTLGFLRETAAMAEKSGLDKDTGLFCTGLEEYLKIIFPNIDDWVHDKGLGDFAKNACRSRPDYRSEKLKMIIEFDGLHHYKDPSIIEKDINTTDIYIKLGYKVVRIPYFIQLTKKAVKTLFNIELSKELFNEEIPSLYMHRLNTPAFLCPYGIKRMAIEFKRFPEQYNNNINFLKSKADKYKNGVELLEIEFNNLP
jgi:hypothetical protein